MDQLLEYIKSAREKGKNDEDIKKALIIGGWQEKIVTQALQNSNNDDLPVPPPPPHAVSNTSVSTTQKSGSPTMWDAFEHILLFISLYTLATSITLLLYYFVDHYVPGVTPTYGYENDSYQLPMVRAYLSAIIVSLPLYLFFFLHITKRTLQNPLIRENHSRKVLIYLTLVVTFIIMVWNVVMIIYTFLNGNVTFNFVLRFFVTILVSGIIFAYYLFQVWEDKKFHA